MVIHIYHGGGGSGNNSSIYDKLPLNNLLVQHIEMDCLVLHDVAVVLYRLFVWVYVCLFRTGDSKNVITAFLLMLHMFVYNHIFCISQSSINVWCFMAGSICVVRT